MSTQTTRLRLFVFVIVLLALGAAGCESSNCWWKEALEEERFEVSNQLSVYKTAQKQLLQLGRPLNTPEREHYWRLEQLIRQTQGRLDEINFELATRSCDE